VQRETCDGSHGTSGNKPVTGTGTPCITKKKQNNNDDNQVDVYGAVIMAKPLREFTRFI